MHSKMITFYSFDINYNIVSYKYSLKQQQQKLLFIARLNLFRFMSTRCVVLNVKYILWKKWVRWLLMKIREKLIASWAFLKGAVLKYRLVKVYSAVTSMNTSNHYAILNYSLLTAKFWSFDVGARGDLFFSFFFFFWKWGNIETKHWTMFLEGLTFS